jgi:hypothetical protein
MGSRVGAAARLAMTCIKHIVNEPRSIERA